MMFEIWSVRRGPWGAGLLILGLFCCGSYTWNTLPLSDFERELVGTWALQSDGRIQIRLTPNRRMAFRGPKTRDRLGHPRTESDEPAAKFVDIGRWSASETEFAVMTRRPRSRGLSSFWRPNSEPLPNLSRTGWSDRNPHRWLSLLDSDHIQFDEDVYVRVQETREYGSDEISRTEP